MNFFSSKPMLVALIFLFSGSVFSNEIDKSIKLSEIKYQSWSGFPALGQVSDFLTDTHGIEFLQNFYIPEGIDQKFIVGNACFVSGGNQKIWLLFPIWTPGPNTIESGNVWNAYDMSVTSKWNKITGVQAIFFNYYHLPHTVVVNCSKDLTLSEIESDLKDQKGNSTIQFYLD